MTYPKNNPSRKWLDIVPSSWRTDRLKDIVPQILGGGTPSSSEPDFWDGQIVWLTPTDFSNGHSSIEISDSARRITQAGLDSCSASLLPKGAVVMASRATIGATRIAGTELATNQGFISFLCDESRLHNRFLYYVIGGYLGDYFSKIAPGTTFSEISRGKAKQETVGFPDVGEQVRIAAFLDGACASIDAALDAKRRQLDLLDDLRRTTIAGAVTAGLDGAPSDRDSETDWFRHAPAHWHIKRLKDVVAKFVDYRGRTPEKTRDGIPLVTARNIRGGRIDFSDSQEYIAEEDSDYWMVRGLPKRGDVLITTEAPIGEVAAVEDERIALAQRIVLLKTNGRMINEYLRYFFLSVAGSAEIRRYATGSTA